MLVVEASLNPCLSNPKRMALRVQPGVSLTALNVLRVTLLVVLNRCLAVGLSYVLGVSQSLIAWLSAVLMSVIYLLL